MRAERAVRRRGNCRRTKNNVTRGDPNSIAREYERYSLIAGLIVGTCFGIIFAIGIVVL